MTSAQRRSTVTYRDLGQCRGHARDLGPASRSCTVTSALAEVTPRRDIGPAPRSRTLTSALAEVTPRRDLGAGRDHVRDLGLAPRSCDLGHAEVTPQRDYGPVSKSKLRDPGTVPR
nr:hypothetical protein Iba_chr03dCG2800 [Ipomoea batatas]